MTIWLDKWAPLVKPAEMHIAPCIWAAEAQKLAISQSGEEALLMIAGQAQIHIITASTTKAALRRHTGLVQTQEHLPHPIREELAHSALLQERHGRNNNKSEKYQNDFGLPVQGKLLEQSPKRFLRKPRTKSNPDETSLVVQW